MLGEPGTAKTFGFAAEQIGSLKVSGTAIPLTAGASNDTFASGKARPVGPTLSPATVTKPDPFAVHAFEV